MGKEIIELSPSIVWKHFYSLTQIPRPSFHEAAVVNHIKEFAISLGLEYIIDDVNNIIVKKPATPGNEGKPGIILQSHVDMVPQKNNDKIHDFEKDPIDTIIDNGWIRANKTTLGADNGIGCAAMLAVLESKDVSHGKIEALFTINEETGMEGAFGLNSGLMDGSIMLNLDSEDEGELFVGCAGGIDVAATSHYTEDEYTSGTTFKLTISGLSGGHSGLDIALGRGNANKLTGRFLWSALSNFPLQVSEVKGGDLRNAIPREGNSVVVIPEKNENDFLMFFKHFRESIIAEFKSSDPNIDLTLVKVDAPKTVIAESDALRLVGTLNAAYNGMVRMSVEMEGIVETSLNLAVVTFTEGRAEMYYLVRSSVDSAKYAVAEQVTALHKLADFTVISDGDYPGWKPNKDSNVLQVASDVYKDLYDKTPGVLAIHAGLECGIIGSKYPGLDILSFGPTIRNPHSPDEKVEINSVDKFWEFLVRILGKI